MFEKNNINQTYINKSTTTIFCPTCKIPMLQCQYGGGDFYWFCGKCHCRVDKTSF